MSTTNVFKILNQHQNNSARLYNAAAAAAAHHPRNDSVWQDETFCPAWRSEARPFIPSHAS